MPRTTTPPIATQQPPVNSNGNGNGHLPSAGNVARADVLTPLSTSTPTPWSPELWRVAGSFEATRGMVQWRTLDTLRGKEHWECFAQVKDAAELLTMFAGRSDHRLHRGDWQLMEDMRIFCRNFFAAQEAGQDWTSTQRAMAVTVKLFESAMRLTEEWVEPQPRRIVLESLTELQRQNVSPRQICQIYGWMLPNPEGSPSGLQRLPDLAMYDKAVKGEIQPPEFTVRPAIIPGPRVKPAMGLVDDCRVKLMEERNLDDDGLQRLMERSASGLSPAGRNGRGVGRSVPGNRPARAYSNVQGDAVQSGDESDGFGESQFFSV